MANFEDFPPIFCPTADFLPQGGGALLPCKIFTSEVVVNVVLSVVLNMMLRLVGGMIAFKLFGGFAL